MLVFFTGYISELINSALNDLKSLLSGKIIYRPLRDFGPFLNYFTTNILSLWDDPVRDQISVEIQSKPNLNKVP